MDASTGRNYFYVEEFSMQIVLNADDGIEISSVDEYMREISRLNEQKNDYNAQLFLEDRLWIIGILSQVFLGTICLVLSIT